MLIALVGLFVLLFNVDIGLDTKTLGTYAFGTILVFGIVNVVIGLTTKNRD
ncbi:hypothetical protein [Roseibium hamelinense]|nr:hypothetical protein [Roseibium hamelinense]